MIKTTIEDVISLLYEHPKQTLRFPNKVICKSRCNQNLAIIHGVKTKNNDLYIQQWKYDRLNWFKLHPEQANVLFVLNAIKKKLQELEPV
jgi:hypothetical protein